MPLAKVTGVDLYRFVDPDSPTRQIVQAEHGSVIDVTDAEFKRGTDMGALSAASPAEKAKTAVKKRTARKKPASPAEKAKTAVQSGATGSAQTGPTKS